MVVSRVGQEGRKILTINHHRVEQLIIQLSSSFIDIARRYLLNYSTTKISPNIKKWARIVIGIITYRSPSELTIITIASLNSSPIGGPNLPPDRPSVLFESCT